MTLYAACLRTLGLDLDQAAAVHARFGRPVRPDTIRRWESGRAEPPPGAFDDLRAFARLIDTALDDAGASDPLLTPKALMLGHARRELSG